MVGDGGTAPPVVMVAAAVGVGSLLRCTDCTLGDESGRREGGAAAADSVVGNG